MIQLAKLKILTNSKVSLEMLARQGMKCPIRDIQNELFRYGHEDYSRVFVYDSNIEIGQVKY